MEHFLAGGKGAVWLELGGKEQSKVVGEEWEERTGGAGGKMY
jgi:hypothetical protein